MLLIRWLGRGVFALCLAFGFTFLAVGLTAFRSLDRRPPPVSAPMIVVLGAGTAADGTLGSNTIPRFELGLALLDAGVSDRIHFTGGEEHRGVTEGPLMAEIARERFPDARITSEGRSRSTLQNAFFTVQQIGPIPPGSILVTDAVHLFRGWASFRWAGSGALVLMPATDLASIPATDRSRRILHETLAVWLNAGRAARYGWLRLTGSDADAAATVLAGGRGG